MENGSDGISKDSNNSFQPDPVSDVEEILRQAGLEEDSDGEYLSAEEDTDTELSDTEGKINAPKDFVNDCKEEESPSFDEANDDVDDKEDTLKKDELEKRQKEEELLTPEELEDRRVNGQNLKAEGNTKFRDEQYDDAEASYSEALNICPLSFHKERAIMFANRSACKMKKEEYEAAIEDSTSAIELHPQYMKALLRRAELYEKTEKLDEALKDYEKIVELDPSQHQARAAGIRLAEQIKERNEKMKDEMMGKLKDLGNLVLRPFGLNVNNFNLQQDPNTGGYSVQFNQKPPGNGS